MSTFKNVNILDTILAKELFYMPGDTVSGVFVGAGHITSGAKSVRFGLSINKIIHSSVSTITMIDNGGTTLRQDNKYVYGDGTEAIKWDGTIDVINVGESSLFVRITSNSISGATNNSAIGILMYYQLKFS